MSKYRRIETNIKLVVVLDSTFVRPAIDKTFLFQPCKKLISLLFNLSCSLLPITYFFSGISQKSYDNFAICFVRLLMIYSLQLIYILDRERLNCFTLRFLFHCILWCVFEQKSLILIIGIGRMSQIHSQRVYYYIRRNYIFESKRQTFMSESKCYSQIFRYLLRPTRTFTTQNKNLALRFLLRFLNSH